MTEAALSTLGRAALALLDDNNNNNDAKDGLAVTTAPSVETKKRGEVSRWTRGEDAALRSLVATAGEAIDWLAVSVGLGSQRSAGECERRWTAVLSRGLQKGRFTGAEDERIVACAREFGDDAAAIDWALVAAKVTGRTPKQCRERWQNSLDPSLTKRKEWSADEDALLLHAHARWKNCWGMVVRALPGRSQNMAKNRWNSSLRRLSGDKFGAGATIDAAAVVAAIPDADAAVRGRAAAKERKRRADLALLDDQSASAVRCLSLLSQHKAAKLPESGDVLRFKWYEDSLDERFELVRIVEVLRGVAVLECLELSEDRFRMQHGARFEFRARLTKESFGRVWRYAEDPVVEPPPRSLSDQEIDFLRATMTRAPMPLLLEEDDEPDEEDDDDSLSSSSSAKSPTANKRRRPTTPDNNNNNTRATRSHSRRAAAAA
ncbi:hypothetical protein CTAYLR_007862 [Chrysophaeum taylorii]|uniref:Uncharacterized protein n=1 Tax=Chrysophaeum taylorii TaxID=2483200 RepID=A0AAD7UD48_9STRA|nr:hypothetical protein CTAYLR_007862 [Chrysophaeum taylorii]